MTGPALRIERVTDVDTLGRGSELFDDHPLPAAAARFLDQADHHLLFAWDEADLAVGFISGVEVTHPDKGTEMFLYELGVAETARGQGVATSLVRALASLAQEVGCYGMWVAAEPDNVGALATYRGAGAQDEAAAVVFFWRLTAGPVRPSG